MQVLTGIVGLLYINKLHQYPKINKKYCFDPGGIAYEMAELYFGDEMDPEEGQLSGKAGQFPTVALSIES